MASNLLAIMILKHLKVGSQLDATACLEAFGGSKHSTFLNAGVMCNTLRSTSWSLLVASLYG